MSRGYYDPFEIKVSDEALCQQFLNNLLDEVDVDELPPSLARLSELAISPNVTGGRGTSPVPTPQPGAPDPSSSEGRPAAGCHSDASEPVDVNDRLA